MERLPVELLYHITDNLDRIHVLTLQLTCRAIHDKLLHLCDQKFFHTITTDLSKDNLESLRRDSQFASLASAVGTLRIDAAYTGEPSIHLRLGRGFYWSRHTSGQVDPTSSGVDLIRNILEHVFPHCRTWYLHADNCEDDVMVKRYSPTPEYIT